MVTGTMIVAPGPGERSRLYQLGKIKDELLLDVEMWEM